VSPLLQIERALQAISAIPEPERSPELNDAYASLMVAAAVEVGRLVSQALLRESDEITEVMQ